MKKKLLLIFILIFASLLIFTSCNNQGGEWTLERVYAVAKENGYKGSLEDFILEFEGTDGVGIKSASVNETGHLIITYTNSEEEDAGLVVFTPDYDKITPEISESGNWLVGGRDTGVSAIGGSFSKWHTGKYLPESSLGDVGDFYLLTESLDVYYKSTLGWSLVGSITNKPVHNSSVASEKAISEALLSSVSIRCYISDEQEQAGSGIIYSINKSTGEAYVLTNHHVVYNSDESSLFLNQFIKVYLYGLEYPQYAISAKYIGGSADKDLAVLKISGSILKNSSAMAAKLGDSDSLAPLDTVFAVGNALDSGISVTSGAVNMKSEYELHENGESLRVIRVDAAINEGNSGGGVYNVDGELIGIATMKIMSMKVDNIAYAIPINFAKIIAENIIRECDGSSNKNAKLYRDGVVFELDSAEIFYDEVRGEIIKKEIIKISELTEGYPAASSELLVGDIVSGIEINGVFYEAQFVYQALELKYTVRVGDTVRYNVVREGEEIIIEMPIAIENDFEIIN